MRRNKTIIFTKRDGEVIYRLLEDIRRFKILTREQEYELWGKMRKGSKSARDLLINSNLRFVLSEAKLYLWSGLSLEDLFQAGAIGLTIAVDSFDATKGNGLISFAVWHIKSEINKIVNMHLRNIASDYLEDTIGNNDDDNNAMRLIDKLCLEQSFNADWDLNYASEWEEKKAFLKDKISDEAACFWVDYLLMHEQGYNLSDVAKRYNVSEECAYRMLKNTMQSLREEFLPYASAA